MADGLQRLNRAWLRANPLPQPDNDTDKNSRGRVLAIGGARDVPGGIRLTVEAALRAGAGKIQVATIDSAALALGVAIPEAAVFGLGETAAGQIALNRPSQLAELLERCDAVVAGPAISDAAAGSRLARALLRKARVPLVLDAGVLMGLARHAKALRLYSGQVVLTPHVGELAALLGCEAKDIERDRIGAVRSASEQFKAICVLKGAESLIVTPAGDGFTFAGGGVGLATGGSGDVLAGIIAGLCARGADLLVATLWGIWLHGEAGRRCAAQIGPIGYMARELLSHVPALLREPVGRSK